MTLMMHENVYGLHGWRLKPYDSISETCLQMCLHIRRVSNQASSFTGVIRRLVTNTTWIFTLHLPKGDATMFNVLG